MSRSDDNLVYDDELGWIDPEDPLGSRGVSCEETTEYYLFRDFHGEPLLKIGKPADFGLLRACLADAEDRSKTWE